MNPLFILFRFKTGQLKVTNITIKCQENQEIEREVPYVLQNIIKKERIDYLTTR